MYNITDEYFEVFKKNNLSFLKDNIFFRDIKLKNVQILKMISFLVRDKNWNNYSPLIKNKNLLNNDKHFTFIFQS